MNHSATWDEEEAAIALLESGDARALEAFEAFLRQDARSVTAHFHLALIWLGRGDLAQALRHARRTLRLSPQEINAHLNLGVIYHKMGRGDLAAQHYKKELQLGDQNPQTWLNLGNRFFDKRQWKRAARCYQKGFDLDHCIEDIVLDLAFCYCKTHQLEAEAALYLKYLERHADDAWALQNLGAVFYDQDDFPNAYKYLQAADEAEPGQPFTQFRLERVRRHLENSNSNSSEARILANLLN